MVKQAIRATLTFALVLAACAAVANTDAAAQVAVIPTVAPRLTAPAPGTPVPTVVRRAPQPNPAGSIVGIEASALSPRDAALMSEAGAAWTRVNALLWSAVEPQPGQRNWGAVAALEQSLRNAAVSQIKVILIVRDTPAWAQLKPGVRCGPVRDDQLAAFGAFMRDVAARYGRPPFNVTAFEIGNEPDVDAQLVPPDSAFGCWGDSGDRYFGGGRYARALAAVHPQVKAGNPRAQLMLGGLLLDCNPDEPPPGESCLPGRFLEGVLQAGGGANFDALSFHAYDFWLPGTVGGYENKKWRSTSATTGPVVAAKAAFLRSTLARFGLNKPLLNTESGLLCWACEQTPAEYELSKAYYVPQAFASAQAAGLAANLWYSYEGWFGTGLLDAAGNPNAAFTAIRVASPILGRAAFSRRLDQAPGLTGYEFTRGGARTWVMWSRDGQAHELTLPSTPSRAFDALGQPIDVGARIIIDAKPVYLQWGA